MALVKKSSGFIRITKAQVDGASGDFWSDEYCFSPNTKAQLEIFVIPAGSNPSSSAIVGDGAGLFDCQIYSRPSSESFMTTNNELRLNANAMRSSFSAEYSFMVNVKSITTGYDLIIDIKTNFIMQT